MKSILMITLAISFILFDLSAFAAEWRQGGGESCRLACDSEGMTPVSSGKYARNGNSYFVCRTNANGEGLRPGYNLQPDWSNRCTVGLGGKEVAGESYDCLCERK